MFSFSLLYALVAFLFLAAVFGLVLWRRGVVAALLATLLGGLFVVAGFFLLVSLALSNM
jgi:hypothetical protein